LLCCGPSAVLYTCPHTLLGPVFGLSLQPPQLLRHQYSTGFCHCSQVDNLLKSCGYAVDISPVVEKPLCPNCGVNATWLFGNCHVVFLPHFGLWITSDPIGHARRPSRVKPIDAYGGVASFVRFLIVHAL